MSELKLCPDGCGDYRYRNGAGTHLSTGNLRCLKPGEYVDEHDQIRICQACRPDARTTRHTCGLAGLQDMIRI